jgi:hypothetical protein
VRGAIPTLDERTFILRFTIAADAVDDEGDDEAGERAVGEWEARVKPELIRALFTQLRSLPHWRAHVRNRGIDPLDEIEIVLQRRANS